MRKQQRDSTANPTLLKTCQTCFNAKIRCDRTQDSGPCDRCQRLGKPCIFAPARRQKTARPKSRIDQLQIRLDQIIDSQAPNPGQGRPSEAYAGTSRDPRPRPRSPAITDPAPQSAITDNLYDPLARGWLDLERAEQLFNVFRSRMAPRFPFVVLPETVTLLDMSEQRPCTYLAILAVAASADFVLQRKLSGLFNQLLAARMAAGKLVSLDMLQGLLLHLAWAHYQPRPRSYTQQLHLATSIVSDLRLDRPRKQQLWNVDSKDEGSAHWGSEELRALIGTYYLASSSSIVLQKMRPIPYTPFINDSCEKLAQQGEFASDKYLGHIVQLQQLSEQVDDIVTNAVVASYGDDVNAKITFIRDQVDLFKSNLNFALSDCPVLGLQLGALELLVSQKCLPGLPGGLGVIQHSPGDNPQLVVDAISGCISASKSITSALLAIPPGYENSMTNLDWIVFSWCLSFSARLDILAGSPRTSHLTQHARRWLDFRHTLHQVVLRLQSLVSPQEDSTGDRDVFYHFLRRARGIETWYLRHTGLSSLSTPVSTDIPLSYGNSTSNTAELNTPALTANPSDSGPVGFENISFADFFTEDMQDPGFGLYLDGESFGTL